MKKLLIIVALGMLLQNYTFSQGCLPEGITFTTQAQIDSFQINYPGCTEIEGQVLINGDSISNLNGLTGLTSIGAGLEVHDCDALTSLTGLEGLTTIGDLYISFNTALTSLSGLENVTSIGNLNITDNTSLSSLTGLDNVTSIGGYLGINENNMLPNLTGLANVTFLGGNLEINNNNNLSSLSGLENLTYIGGGLEIFENNNLINLTGLGNVNYIFCLYIEWNQSLTSLTGLENLDSTGFLYVANNNSLTSLTGLSSLTSIGGYLYFGDNFSLTSLTGLNSVSSIGGYLWIKNNNSLVNLNGLDTMTSIGGGLLIESNNSLMSLTGLDNLTSIGGEELLIGYNNSLVSLTGLENLTSIGGYLSIENNNSLVNITGLENLTSIGGMLSINTNISLTTLDGLQNIPAGSIAGLFIHENSSLSNCSIQSICDYLASPNGVVQIFGNSAGCDSPPEVANNCGITLPCLPYGDYYFLSQADIDNFTTNYTGCKALEGNVSIHGNDISNLLGLVMIAYIGGDLMIGMDYSGQGSNPFLTSLEGLDSLTSIGGDLDIGHNDALTSLTGLDNINAGSIHDLYIYNNTSLSTCEVQSVCNYLAAPGGIISISSNAPGCNSQEEVEAACQVGFESIPFTNTFTIYPNPSNGQFTVEFYLQQPSMVNLVVQNNFGQVVEKLADGILTSGTHQVFWNAMNLPEGIYYGRLQAGDQIFTNKIIKIQ